MDDDLVKRLRDDLPGKLVEKHWVTDWDAIEATYTEAADRIEALCQEVQELMDELAYHGVYPK
jgi:hypothetical protein